MEVHLMTEMMSGVEHAEDPKPESGLDDLDERLIDQLVGQPKAGGLKLTGEGGVLQQLTRRLLESALEGEITDHLGYDRHDPAGRGTGNSRNGTRSKTVLTDVGPVEIDVPRDRNAEFEPRIVTKRQKRLTGAEASRQTISSITDKVAEGMTEWQNRPLDVVYPVIFIDAIHVKVR
ncbi:MAG TPA: transposase, partial [Umezawaea sp.]|nr:transposase [Umezawaea sp.]